MGDDIGFGFGFGVLEDFFLFAVKKRIYLGNKNKTRRI